MVICFYKWIPSISLNLEKNWNTHTYELYLEDFFNRKLNLGYRFENPICVQVFNRWEDDLVVYLKYTGYKIDSKEYLNDPGPEPTATDRRFWNDNLVYRHLRCTIEHYRDHIIRLYHYNTFNTQKNNKTSITLNQFDISLSNISRNFGRWVNVDNILAKVKNDYFLEFMGSMNEEKDSDLSSNYYHSFVHLVNHIFTITGGQGGYSLYFDLRCSEYVQTDPDRNLFQCNYHTLLLKHRNSTYSKNNLSLKLRLKQLINQRFFALFTILFSLFILSLISIHNI